MPSGGVWGGEAALNAALWWLCRGFAAAQPPE